MRTHRLFSAALCCCALCSAGCAVNRPAAPLGGTVGLTMAQQILDPQAGLARPLANGLDGQAAKSAYDSYQKSYRAPQPQRDVFTIGVGADGGGGGR